MLDFRFLDCALSLSLVRISVSEGCFAGGGFLFYALSHHRHTEGQSRLSCRAAFATIGRSGAGKADLTFQLSTDGFHGSSSAKPCVLRLCVGGSGYGAATGRFSDSIFSLLGIALAAAAGGFPGTAKRTRSQLCRTLTTRIESIIGTPIMRSPRAANGRKEDN